jgi:hypothetical protein
MSLLNLISERYDRETRLYPAFLVVAPMVVSWVTLVSANFTVIQSLAPMLVGGGGAFLLSQLARDAGKKAEKKLFERWGGLPSVAIFRHRDSRLDSVTKTRYHKKLAGLVKEARAPTPEQEQEDPAAADATYLAWSKYLRVNTSDTKKFALLFQENVSYGYRRNVWGLRAIGIIVSLLSGVGCGARLYFLHLSTGKINDAVAGAGAFAIIMILLWLFRFTVDWVRVPADAYAERLAESVEILDSKTPTKKS